MKHAHNYISNRVFDGIRLLHHDDVVRLQRAYDRQRLEPKTLLSLWSYDEACRLIFKGLHDHYLESVASNRLTEWKNAAHAAIELLGSPPVRCQRRADQ